MSKLSAVCLSLTPNLRCFGFTHRQFVVLIIPPAIEVIISLFFIYLHPGPDRLGQLLLATDGMLYFIWALLDMLSHIVPSVQHSSSVSKTLDIFIGAVSFTPILLYSIYLYRLSFRDFIPTLPRKLQPYLVCLLPVLLLVAVAINEVSSLVGPRLGTPSSSQIVEFLHNDMFLWLSLSRSSLAVFAFTQFLFFLLAFSRLSKAFLNQRRIELTHSDEHHFFHGIAWITTGITIGVAETITGFAHLGFAAVLARRTLRVAGRIILMFGLLQGLDVAENFENLTDELRGISRIHKRISNMLGVNSRRMSMFRRISQASLYPSQSQSQSRGDECERSLAEKQSRDQRVTIRYERGQAPILQIRFSNLDFPAQAILADTSQQGRRSLSGLIPGHANAGNCMQQDGESLFYETAATRDAIFETPRARSALVVTDDSHHTHLDWTRPPDMSHRRQGSGGTVSDNLSVIRDLERRFPSLPPRVTGKYRGSILGQNYEDDPFPVVGISRQSSMRQGGGQNVGEEGGAPTTLSPSNSIKRKPAPPLLENLAYISDWGKRPESTWGQDAASYPMDSPVLPDSPWDSTTALGSPSAAASEPSPSRSRRRTARDIIKRASRALSDASIRSAEWLASASSPSTVRTPLTASDIEMYRKGTIGPRSAPPTSVGANSSLSDDTLLPRPSRSPTDGTVTQAKPSRPRINTTNIGVSPIRTTPAPSHAEHASGRERVISSYGLVNLLDGNQLRTPR